MLLTKNKSYSCTIKLNLKEMWGTDQQVVDYLKTELPKQGALFQEITSNGGVGSRHRRVTGKYVGETKDIKLDSRISNVQEI